MGIKATLRLLRKAILTLNNSGMFMDGAAQIAFLEWVLGGGGFLLAAVTGWVWLQMVGAVKGLRSDMTELSTNIGNVDKAHQEYKLEAEKRYAKDEEVNNKFEQLHSSQKGIEKDINEIKVSLATLATVIGTQTKQP